MFTRPKNTFPQMLKEYSRVMVWYLPYLMGIYLLYEYLGFEQLDIKMSIATVLGVSIALILGFRTAAAYDRWWEARKIWGAIVNDSRTLVRQLITFTDPSKLNADVIKVSHYQIAWIYSLKNSLRKLDPIQESEIYLDKTDIEYLKTTSNKPNSILQLMGNVLNRMRENNLLDPYQMVSVDHTYKNLCDHMGKCERIRNTVFPIHYASFARIGVILFIIMLPYGMLYSTGPFMIVICILVSFFFIMIDTIAHYLQDPFNNISTDTPMSALCRTIEINILEMIDATEKPAPVSPDKNGVLM